VTDHLPGIHSEEKIIDIAGIAAQQCAGENQGVVRTGCQRSQAIALCRIVGQLVRLVADGIVEPVVHIAPDEIQGCYAPDSLAVGLPERAIDRPSRFQIGVTFAFSGTADYLAQTCFPKVGFRKPAVAEFHARACIRVDDTSEIPSGPSHVIGVPPKVRQLPFVSPYYEQGRSGADLLLPAGASTLVALPQTKIGEAAVQAFADDLSVAQPHFVDAAWRATVADSVPETVNQKYP
jgi:hypothetical protein